MSYCQDKSAEDLFGMLRRSNGTKFDEKFKKTWYKARKYVLEALG